MASSSASTDSQPANGFLRLPPELRNRIYSYIVADDTEPVILNQLRLPPLANTCRQIRQEFVPFFLAEAHINIVIGANFENRAAVRFPLVNFTLSDRVTQNSGQIFLLPRVKHLLGSVPGPVILRNISVVVFHGRDMARVAYRLDTSLLNTSICKLNISFDVRSGLRKTLEIGAFSTRTGMFFNVIDIRDAAKYAVAMAKSAVTGRENFQGFTLAEIAKVAALFRYGN